MQRLVSAGLLAALAGWAIGAANPAASQTLFDYHGHVLHAVSGNGVPDARRLHFILSGQLPVKGACRNDLTIVSVSDGAFSLKQLLSYGFTVSPSSSMQVCRDKTSGALSESFYLSLQQRAGAVIEAAYSWTSRDPRKGAPADSVTEFYNVEYHVSSAAKAGQLVAVRTNP